MVVLCTSPEAPLRDLIGAKGGVLVWQRGSLVVCQLAERQQYGSWALKSEQSGFELWPRLLQTPGPSGRHLSL